MQNLDALPRIVFCYELKRKSCKVMDFQIVALKYKVLDARRPEICYAFRNLE